MGIIGRNQLFFMRPARVWIALLSDTVKGRSVGTGVNPLFASPYVRGILRGGHRRGAVARTAPFCQALKGRAKRAIHAIPAAIRARAIDIWPRSSQPLQK